MHYAAICERIAGESVATWDVHYRAMKRQQAGEDIFLLSVGQESDTYSPAGVMDAAVASIQNGRHHYTPVEGDIRLRTVIANHHSELCGTNVSPDHVVVFAGAQNALFATAQLLLGPGDEVILIEPYYTTYPATFTASGAAQVSVALDPKQNFQLDAERVIAAITPHTRAIVVNSPNNPTGAIYSREHLQKLVDVCRQQQIWLISDEVYMEIVDDPDPCRPGALPGAEQVVVTISSVSKSHRMTGWRVGWAIGPAELAGHYYNLNMCMSYGLCGVNQDAAVHALERQSGVSDEVTRRLARQRKVVIDELSSVPDTRLYSAGGGMFVILDIRDTEISAMDFAGKLLDSEGVSVQPLTGFGKSCDGLLRISAVLQEDRLREALRRINRFVRGLR